MLAVAVSDEYCAGHSRFGLAVSVTVQETSGTARCSPRGLAGIAAPIPAPGVAGGRAGTGFPVRRVAAPVAAAELVATGAAVLAAAAVVAAMIRPGTASAIAARPARR
jgi:hypothetical protein